MWYNANMNKQISLSVLSDEGTVTEGIDSRAFSDFCGVESSNQAPDGDALGHFLESVGAQQVTGETVCASGGVAGREETDSQERHEIVDSTLISAPSSTKNREKGRDPEARSTRKGKQWHFGYKAHVGADRDSGYLGAEEREDAVTRSKQGKKIRYKINRGPSHLFELTIRHWRNEAVLP